MKIIETKCEIGKELEHNYSVLNQMAYSDDFLGYNQLSDYTNDLEKEHEYQGCDCI